MPAGLAVDCDDTSPGRSPGAIETCATPGVDDDCDGTADEGLTVMCYADEDNDTYAPTGAMLEGICPNMARASVGFCPISYTNRAPVSAASRDCNDMAGVGFDVHPGAPELCDMVDNDCDGTTDDGATVMCYADADDDGYPAAGAASSTQCRATDRTDRGDCPRNFTFRNPAMVPDRDCGSTDPSIHPGATEICDMIDQDCDGSTTDVVMVTCYADSDNDTYAAMGTASSLRCPDPLRSAVGECPSGFTNRMPTMTIFDCAAMDPTRNPGVTEMCDAPMFVDANCNGGADEGSVRCYPDNDDDGWAPLGSSGTDTCIEPTRANEPHLGCPFRFTGRNPSTIATADCNDTAMADHVIVQCYTDVDRDTFRLTGSALMNSCYAAGAGFGGCPLGQTTRPDVDCCDSENDAYTGQSMYFTTARAGCGGYDYNCNGTTTQLYTAVSTGTCGGLREPSDCEDAVIGDGWFGAVPACGTGSSWRTDCRWVFDPDLFPDRGYCEDEETGRTQACR
jgi:hypothetical protein